MLRFLIVFLLVLPFADMYVLFQVSNMLGFWQTMTLVLLTGLIGAELIRREGKHVLMKLQQSVTGGEISRNMMEGLIILLCGIFLLTPGFITDLIGFLLIFRPLRVRLVAGLMNSIESNMSMEVRTF